MAHLGRHCPAIIPDETPRVRAVYQRRLYRETVPNLHCPRLVIIYDQKTERKGRLGGFTIVYYPRLLVECPSDSVPRELLVDGKMIPESKFTMFSIYKAGGELTRWPSRCLLEASPAHTL